MTKKLRDIKFSDVFELSQAEPFSPIFFVLLLQTSEPKNQLIKYYSLQKEGKIKIQAFYKSKGNKKKIEWQKMLLFCFLS